MLRSVPQMLKKMKNRRKQNFEGEANNKLLNKEDTRRSNYNRYLQTVNGIFILSQNSM